MAPFSLERSVLVVLDDKLCIQRKCERGLMAGLGILGLMTSSRSYLADGSFTLRDGSR